MDLVQDLAQLIQIIENLLVFGFLYSFKRVVTARSAATWFAEVFECIPPKAALKLIANGALGFIAHVEGDVDWNCS